MIPHNSRTEDVESFLRRFDIQYEKEKTFDDLVDKSKLRFDYYLPDYNLCIEFNGAQHYEYVEYFHRNEDNFQHQIYKDYLKKKYCQENSIYFLEIPCDLTINEVHSKLINTLNKIGNFDFELLPKIDEFLRLNESREVYINKLYEEYKSMLKQLNINHATNYDTFNDYVINYWNLTSYHIVKEKNKYYDCWVNESINKFNDRNDGNNGKIIEINERMKIFQEYLINHTNIFDMDKIPLGALKSIYCDILELREESDASKISTRELIRRNKQFFESYGFRSEPSQRMRQSPIADYIDINQLGSFTKNCVNNNKTSGYIINKL